MREPLPFLFVLMLSMIRDSFVRKTVIVISLVILAAAIVATMVYANQVLLLSFAGILLAVLLYGVGDWLHRKTKMSIHVSLTVTIFAFALLVAGIVAALGPIVSHQIEQLQTTLPELHQQFEEKLSKYETGRRLIVQYRLRNMLPSRELVSQLTLFASTTMGILFSIAFIIALGCYFAYQPQTLASSKQRCH